MILSKVKIMAMTAQASSFLFLVGGRLQGMSRTGDRDPPKERKMLRLSWGRRVRFLFEPGTGRHFRSSP